MIAQMKWTREPREYRIENDLVEITTEPHTDLWQRTYYHFRNDNAPLLHMLVVQRIQALKPFFLT